MTPNRIARIRQSILDHYREHNAVDRCMNCQTAEVLIAVEKDSFRKGASMEREACAKIVEQSSLPDAYSEPVLLEIAKDI